MTSRGIFCALAIALLCSTSARAQQWDWIRRLSPGADAIAIAVDSHQNVYVGGMFTGTNEIGTNQLVSAGSNDVFLLKLNADGEVQWAISTGGPLNDSISRLIVTTNGALFVIGDFTIARTLFTNSPAADSEDVTGVFIARVDDGKFTWYDTSSVASGLTLASDGTIWVAGYSEIVFSARYTQDGHQIERRQFDPSGLPRWHVVADRDGNPFLSGTFSSYLEIGSNTLRPPYYIAQLTAGLGIEGVRWYWSASLGYESHSTGIIGAPDGGVISIGYIQTRLPYRSAFVAKHAPEGTLLWSRSLSGGGCTKRFWTPTAISFDANGNVLLAGGANSCPVSPYDRAFVWILTLDQNGNTLAEQRLGTDERSIHSTPQLAIAGDAEGALFLAGMPPSRLALGTNTVADPSRDFIARQSTQNPSLRTESLGNNVMFSWPRAAFPFALQQSDETGTNWSLVSEPPILLNGRWHVTLPGEMATGMFRLLRTNEAPIRHVPRWLRINGPFGTFLQHTNVAFAGSRLVLTATAQDFDEEPLVFDWRDASGERLSGTNNVKRVGPSWNPSAGYRYPPDDEVTFSQDPMELSPGFHTIQVVAFDGVFAITNSWTFEVISSETALQEFFAAIEVLRADRLGRKALAFLDGYQRAKSKGRDNLAEKRWSHFQRQLARVTSLTEEERGRLSSAAEQVKSLLPAPSP